MRKKLEKPILAVGEATGHFHAVVSEKPVDVYELSSGIKEFFATTDVEIVHQEHHKLNIPAGDYCSDTVEEYDHFAEEARKVKD